MDIPGLIDRRMGGLRLIEKMKSKMEKVICVAVMVCLIFLYSGGKISDWVTLPENIYQISEDKIQVADLIEEVTGGAGHCICRR